MQVAKVRATLRVERDPHFRVVNLQLFEIDVAAQIERVEVWNANRCEKAVKLAELFAALRVVEFHIRHLDGARREFYVRAADFGADSVFGESLNDLIRNDLIEPSRAKENDCDDR